MNYLDSVPVDIWGCIANYVAGSPLVVPKQEDGQTITERVIKLIQNNDAACVNLASFYHASPRIRLLSPLYLYAKPVFNIQDGSAKFSEYFYPFYYKPEILSHRLINTACVFGEYVEVHYKDASKKRINCLGKVNDLTWASCCGHAWLFVATERELRVYDFSKDPKKPKLLHKLDFQFYTMKFVGDSLYAQQSSTSIHVMLDFGADECSSLPKTKNKFGTLVYLAKKVLEIFLDTFISEAFKFYEKIFVPTMKAIGAYALTTWECDGMVINICGSLFVAGLVIGAYKSAIKFYEIYQESSS